MNEKEMVKNRLHAMLLSWINFFTYFQRTYQLNMYLYCCIMAYNLSFKLDRSSFTKSMLHVWRVKRYSFPQDIVIYKQYSTLTFIWMNIYINYVYL